MPTLETHNGYALWQYIPSLPAAIIFTILFAIATVLHATTTFKRRMWFCIPFIVGGLFEVVGYIGRALAYNATGDIGPYIMQSLLVLLAPVLFSASLYMTLGRTIRAVRGEQYSVIPPRWLTRIFVAGDCFSFFVQSSGGGLLAAGSKTISPSLAQDIIVAGLVLQIVLFGIFCLVALMFHSRFRKRQTINTQHIPWRSSLMMLYLTSAAILVRNVFRVVEYVMGQNGYLLRHEWCSYVFDAALMLFAMVIFWWYWPIDYVALKQQDTAIQLNSGSSHGQLRPKNEQV